MNWRRQLAYTAVALLFASPIAAPQLLAFPYSAPVGAHRVYSEQPITAEVREVIETADVMAARSPIALRPAQQPLVLTEGGWRWTWLTLNFGGTFALSRPVTETIVINRSDAASDEVFNRGKVGGRRSLSGTIAHEITHGAIRNRFGTFADFRYPAWLREGYCDHVAGGGSLSDEEARRLIASGSDHPAIAYWRGRKRVEQQLGANGGSVEALFAQSGH